MSDDSHKLIPGGYRPRLSVDLTETQANKMRELIPHGLKTPLFHAIIDEIILFLESAPVEQRNLFMGLVINKLAYLRDFFPQLEMGYGPDRTQPEVSVRDDNRRDT